MRWPSSLRARLTLWYTALLGIPLVVLALGFYALFARTLQDRTDRFVADALTAFARELGAERRASLSAIDAIRATLNEVRFQDLRVAVFDSSGALVAESPATDVDERDGATAPADVTALVTIALRKVDATHPQAFTVSRGGWDYLVNARPFVLDSTRLVLAGTYSLRDIDEVLERVRTLLIVLVPLLLVIAVTGGYFLATRGLVPLSAMAARAAEISAANLQDRLPVSGGEELSRLARVFNGLLDRLETSFGQQKRFMADASHELRTPTSILRAEAEVTLSREHRDESEYRASLTIIRDSALRLTRIVEDLFLLARADAGVLVEQREPVNLEDVVHDATRDVRFLAERRGIRVSFDQVIEAPLRGDAGLLGRVMLNLLDNAIKHAPDKSTVVVEMSSDDGRYDVTVTDSGPGVPDAAQSRIFERFFRADAARSRREHSSTGGAGLGLAIARRIAEVHGGTLELVESRPGHTQFRFSVPAEAEALASFGSSP